MMQMVMDDGRLIFVIEPGNIQRLKNGEPLIIAANVSIMFTPDMEAFSKLLTDDFPQPKPGEVLTRAANFSAEHIIRCFAACKDMPEVIR
jgi:hypothetical protein